MQPCRLESLETRVLFASQTFTIDSALSFATGSGVVSIPTKVNSNGDAVGPSQTIALKAQSAGSLTNHASGTITADVTGSSIQFLTAAVKAGASGSKALPGNSPANFAALFSGKLVTPQGTDVYTFYLDVRGLVAGMTSGKLGLSQGKFSAKGQKFALKSGTLGIYAVVTSGPDKGNSTLSAPLSQFASSVANQSLVKGSLVVDKKGNETLTVYASGTVTEALGPVKATLSLSGQIVAHGHA
jgi:hypothetical protein